MFVIEILKAVIIGVVQGITEWLPISSTGHMILIDEFIKLNVSDAFLEMFLVVIQFGSILAVLLLYFNKLNPFSPSKSTAERKDTLFIWVKVIIGVIPAGIVGLLFDDKINEIFYNPLTVAITLVLYGILFILIENRNTKPKINDFNELDYKTAFKIGIFQILALVPGTSRSGSTILGAALLGTSRYIAAEYSFFLAIPIMFGASALKMLKYFLEEGVGFSSLEWQILLTGMIVAFLISVFAIKFLMVFIKKHDFKVFGYYRIILGIIVILYFCFKSNLFLA